MKREPWTRDRIVKIEANHNGYLSAHVTITVSYNMLGDQILYSI